MNAPHIQWVQGSNGLTSFSCEGRYAENIVDFMECNGFSKLNGVTNALGRTLDLCFTDLPLSSITVTNAVPFCKVDSHHPPLRIQISFAAVRYAPQREMSFFNFRKANYEVINDEITTVDWYQVLDCSDVDAVVDRFYDVINDIIHRCVHRTLPRHPKNPIWFSQELTRLLRRKNKAHKKFKHTRDPLDYTIYSNLRRQAKQLLHTCERSYLDDLQRKSKSEVKPFWAYARSLRKSNSVPNETFYGSRHYTGTNEIVEGFADFFSTTFAATSQQLFPFRSEFSRSDTFSFGTVTDADIFHALSSLKEDKGMGPDGISNVFLKRSARSLSIPLAFIFNRMLTSQRYPERWKLGNMTPIFKDGDAMNLENYRGVVVQNGFGHVIERILKDQLQSHMLKFMHPSQHGFLKNRSTLSNLLETVQKFNDVVDDGGQVDAVYFDVSKAFDKVPHSLLLEKCKAYGLSEGTIHILRTYLLNRAYQVRLNGVSSRPIYATSGVGQGSVLGPLLYLLFFNDLLFKIADWCWAFADDIKIARRIKTINDALRLQQTINDITQWCAYNGLTLNVRKSKHITISRQRRPFESLYFVNGVPLEKAHEVRDLGVIVDSRLSFSPHVDMIVRKAARLSGFVMRLCRNFNQLDPMISLFNRIVRPILEYCSPSWNPYYSQYVERIEAVQHTFTRFLYRKFHYPYEPYQTRISRLQMTSLCDRRRVLDMCTLHRLVHGSIHCSLTNDIQYRFPTHGLRHVDLFHVPRSRTNLGKSAPLSRLCQTYNESYNDVDIFLNLTPFKRIIRDQRL